MESNYYLIAVAEVELGGVCTTAREVGFDGKDIGQPSARHPWSCAHSNGVELEGHCVRPVPRYRVDALVQRRLLDSYARQEAQELRIRCVEYRKIERDSRRIDWQSATGGVERLHSLASSHECNREVLLDRHHDRARQPAADSCISNLWMAHDPGPERLKLVPDREHGIHSQPGRDLLWIEVPRAPYFHVTSAEEIELRERGGAPARGCHDHSENEQSPQYLPPRASQPLTRPRAQRKTTAPRRGRWRPLVDQTDLWEASRSRNS